MCLNNSISIGILGKLKHISYLVRSKVKVLQGKEMRVMEFVWILISAIGLFVLFNWLMGYRKEHIQIDFEERYFKEKEYIAAIKRELEDQGRVVQYKGNRKFVVDGQSYLFIERNVPMGGVPMQRTILKPVKE
jgi:hypothetical protein